MLKFEPKLFLINIGFYLFFMLLLLAVLALAKYLDMSASTKAWLLFCILVSFFESRKKERK